jgi:hypothetical protein
VLQALALTRQSNIDCVTESIVLQRFPVFFKGNLCNSVQHNRTSQDRMTEKSIIRLSS